MKLDLSDEERRSLIRTLRWVLVATVMDGAGEQRLRSIIERLDRLAKPAVPPRVK